MPTGWNDYSKKPTIPKFNPCHHAYMHSERVYQVYKGEQETIAWYTTCARRYCQQVPGYLLDKLSSAELWHYSLEKCKKCNIECNQWANSLYLERDKDGQVISKVSKEVIKKHITLKNRDISPFPVTIYIKCEKPKEEPLTGSMKKMADNLKAKMISKDEPYEDVMF